MWMRRFSNMKKVISKLFILLALTLTNCSSVVAYAKLNDEPIVATVPPYAPPTPPEPSKNIESINVLGIPEDYKIGMGLFDEANLRYEITYTDNTKEEFPLIEENLPYALKEMLGQEGEHNITLQIRNKLVTFKIIMVDVGIRYVVRFLNYNEEVLYMTKVMPNNKVSYDGETPRRMSDMVYKYQFNGWDRDLDLVIEDSTDIHATYEDNFKINDYLPIESGSKFVSSYVGSVPNYQYERSYVCHYLGRLTRVPLARDRSGYINHTQGNREEVDYGFSDLDTPIYRSEDQTTDFHPDAKLMMTGLISKSYHYEAPGEEVDPKYIPADPNYIHFYPDNYIPFELHSARARNVEGKMYDTSVNDYLEAITEYFATDRGGVLHIAEDFPSGNYTPTVFMDCDVYAYAAVENNAVLGLKNDGIYTVICPAEIYIGLNSEDNQTSTTYYPTSTYDADGMGIELFIEMVKEARQAFEE